MSLKCFELKILEYSQHSMSLIFFWMEPTYQLTMYLFRQISLLCEYQPIITFLHISGYLLEDSSRIMHV